MNKSIYVMKNKKIGSLTGSFESDEEIADARKKASQNRSLYESEQIKVWKEFGINREKWDEKYKNKKLKNKENLIAHAKK